MWQENKPNLQVGDLVLLKDTQVKRNDWPLGVITKTMTTKDRKVCKVEVKIIKEGNPKVFQRPTSDVILLLPKEEE